MRNIFFILLFKVKYLSKFNGKSPYNFQPQMSVFIDEFLYGANKIWHVLLQLSITFVKPFILYGCDQLVPLWVN